MYNKNYENFDNSYVDKNIMDFFKKLNYEVFFYEGVPESIGRINELVKNNDPNKKYILFLMNDYNDDIFIPDNFILYRTALYKSKRKYNEFIFPTLDCNEPSHNPEYKKQLTPVIKTNKPKISFSGNYNSHPNREIWMNKLKNSELLECHFTNTYMFKGGGIKQLISHYNTSEFCFCPRGVGNFSIRFYETLFYGRIPVLIDTDILLPFENIIEWNKYIIIGKTINEVIAKIIDFWENNDIIEAQNNVRKIYDMYFSQENVTKIMLKEINQIQ